MKSDLNDITLLTTFDPFSQRNIRRTNQMKRLIRSDRASVDLTSSGGSKLVMDKEKGSMEGMAEYKASFSMTTMPRSKCEESLGADEVVNENDPSLLSIEASPNKEIIESNAKELLAPSKGLSSMRNNLVMKKNGLENATESYRMALGGNEHADSKKLLASKFVNSIIEEEKSEMITDSEASNKKKNALQSSQRKMELASRVVLSNNDKDRDAERKNECNVKDLHKMFFSSMKKERKRKSLIEVIDDLMKAKHNNKKIALAKKPMPKPKPKEVKAMVSHFSVPLLFFSRKQCDDKSRAVLTCTTKPSVNGNIDGTCLSSYRKGNKSISRKVLLDIPRPPKPSAVQSTKESSVQLTSTRNSKGSTMKSKGNKSQHHRTNTLLNLNVSLNTRSDSFSSKRRDNSQSQMNVCHLALAKNNGKVSSKTKQRSHSIFNTRSLIPKPQLCFLSNRKAIQALLISRLIHYSMPHYQQEALTKLNQSKGKAFVLYVAPFSKGHYLFKGLFNYTSNQALLTRLMGTDNCPYVLSQKQITTILIEDTPSHFIESDRLSPISSNKAVLVLTTPL